MTQCPFCESVWDERRRACSACTATLVDVVNAAIAPREKTEDELALLNEFLSLESQARELRSDLASVRSNPRIVKLTKFKKRDTLYQWTLEACDAARVRYAELVARLDETAPRKPIPPKRLCYRIAWE